VSNQPIKQELRRHLRLEPRPEDTTVVVRGGRATAVRLATHAQRTRDAFVPDGQPVWGVSVFCALDDIGPASLEGVLRRFWSYRTVHLSTAGKLREAGFEPLPSFARPHFTLRLITANEAELNGLVAALGS
jgi:hypothetical protein